MTETWYIITFSLMLNVEKRTNLMDNAHELVYLKPGNISGVYIKFNFMKKGQIYFGFKYFLYLLKLHVLNLFHNDDYMIF